MKVFRRANNTQPPIDERCKMGSLRDTHTTLTVYNHVTVILFTHPITAWYSSFIILWAVEML